MRIAFIGSRGIPHSYASAEQLVRQIGPRLVERGHEFIVYCHANQFSDRRPYYNGVRRIFIPTIYHKFLEQLIQSTLSAVDVLFRSVDVVHFQCLTVAFQSLLPWAFGKICVVNVDGQEWDNPKWHPIIRNLFFKPAARVALLTSREIITDAKGMSDIYMERYGRGSSVIAYGADIEESTNPEVLQEYGLQPGQYYFVAARLVPSNNTDVIVEAFKQVKTDKILAIAGGHSYGSRWYKRLVENAGPRIRFLGHISDQLHINELYCNSYAYLHGASLGGINSALLRPLGCGTCCLALDTPFNREVLEMNDGTLCGLIWLRNVKDLREKIQLIEDSPEMAASFRKLGPKRIREAFTWERITNQYEIFYRGLLEDWPAEKIRLRVAEA